MLPYLLGIDIGTGSTKAVALSFDGAVLASAQHHYDISSPQQGYSEQDPEMIWQAFVSCVNDVVKQLNYQPEGMGFSSAMHSLIAVDKGGKALHPMITWADTRSEAIAKNIRESAQAEELYRQTGTPIHPMSPLCKLIWLRENDNELVKKTAKFISIKEYIWYKLFNHFEVDYSIASATGLFDIKSLTWSTEACNLAGVTPAQLSEPVNTNYTRRDIDEQTAALLSIAASTPVVIGASDGCCANLGSQINDTITAALTIGTSGAVRITSKTPIYNFKAMTFNYLLNENTYVCGGAVNNGGIAVDWLIRNFLNLKDIKEDSYHLLFAAIDEVPAGSDGLLFLPYLYGDRAPIWDSQSSGAFLNVKPQHTQNHFLRAALEGICYALNDVIVTLESTANITIERLNISGGFVNSKTWVQTLADITGKKLSVIQQEDASTIGAILLTLDALFPGKTIPTTDETIITDCIPQNHDVYLRAFSKFRKVYQDLKESMHGFE
ncbi:gluconokinase [Mucilaginibacter sp. PAMB04168]|uniref:gluconokinase n=1 Tax=Mucilaginibacter sp. PAMB04168 TaxID=3138567 RepID=UPI0031F60794